MTTIQILRKEEVQKKLSKHFNNFSKETINGSSFSVKPLKENIPLVKRARYVENKDVFEVVFEYKEKTQMKSINNIQFIEDIDGRLVGIRILKIKENNIKGFVLTLKTTLDKEIKQAWIDIHDSVIEKRKISFMKDIIESEFKKIRHRKSYHKKNIKELSN